MTRDERLAKHINGMADAYTEAVKSAWKRREAETALHVSSANAAIAVVKSILEETA